MLIAMNTQYTWKKTGGRFASTNTNQARALATILTEWFS